MGPLLALVMVTWTPVPFYEDGSPLDLGTELDGYRISWSIRGEVQPDIAVQGNVVEYDLGEHLGRVCVVLRAIAHGVESDPSTISCKKIKPGRPTIIEVK